MYHTSVGLLFYNGDLSIKISEEVNNTSHAGRVSSEIDSLFLQTLDVNQRFNRLSGKSYFESELEERFSSRIRTISIDSLDEINPSAASPGRLLVAPLNEDRLHWWAEKASDKPILRLSQDNVKIILAPSTEAANNAPPALFDCLEANGIHVIYTKNFENGVPEEKLFDTLVCTGDRTMYESRQLVDKNLTGSTRLPSPGDFDTFESIYADLSGVGVLGDPCSGSSSIRSDVGLCFITATRTNKLDLTESEISSVINYSPTSHTVSWLGDKKPSSSIPWHSAIYHHFDWVNAILHTHNKSITYSSQLSDHVTQKYLPYGSIHLANQLVEELQHRQRYYDNILSQFLIMKGHGEVVFGESMSECLEVYEELASIVNE